MNPIGTDTQRSTILVVEDNALILAMATDALEDAGFGVIGVTAAEDALGLAVMDVPFDALFTDIDLAGPLNGWALAETLRDMRADLPVLYTSGKPAEAALSVPGSRFFAKPYRLDEVCAFFERAITARDTIDSPPLMPAPAETSSRPELRLMA